MLLLEQNTTIKDKINKNNKTKLDINKNKSRKYKVKAIYNYIVFIKCLTGHFIRLYYLFLYKNYL